jgi:outer membrane protein assembly factor BamB
VLLISRLAVPRPGICCGSILAILFLLALPACRGPAPPAATTGFPLSEQWSFTADSKIFATPSTDSDLVVVRTIDGIVALDALTGLPRWSWELPGSIMPGSPPASLSPLIAHGLVVATTHRGVTALDDADGTVVWEDAHGWLGTSAFPAAATSEVVYVSESSVRAYELATGRELWAVGLAGAPRNTAFVFPIDENVILISLDLLQLRTQSGELVWEDADGNWAPRGATLHGGVLYCSRNGALVAFDTQTRSELWLRVVHLSGFGPLATDDRLFVVPFSGAPWALDTATGDRLWLSSIPGNRYQTPVLFDGVLYVAEVPTTGKTSTNIYALSVEDGSEMGRLTVDGQVSQPIATDELLIFASGDTVYAYSR